MKFGEMAIDEASGAVLAHSTRVLDGMLKKGRILSADDVQRLRAAGRSTVIAARLDADDVTEDVAAQRIAAIVAGPQTRIAAPFTGRANIFASADGVTQIDAARLTHLNAIDERMTVATVPPYTRIAAGQMIATIKIIPFAVPAAVVARAEHELQRGLIAVAPFRKHHTGLILTAFEGTKPQVLDRRRDAVAQRLASLGSTVATTLTVGHTTQEVGDAIQQLLREGRSPIFIFAASAIVDRHDVIPAAVVAAGGIIERLGMPVDPGNLLLLARHEATPVIGLPSCAASLKLNGFDWVLERLLAGLEVTSTDVAQMGASGLLKEIDSRPQPRLGSGAQPTDVVRQAPRIAALVLAAGRSTRMGRENKLLADVGGVSIVRRVVETALASSAAPIHVVVGHQAADVKAALAGLDVTYVESAHFTDGLSASLRAGLAALPDDIDGALVMLGDMPEIAPDLIDRLIAAFAPKEGRSIVVPCANSKRGNPVLWAKSFFAEMAEVSGDTGAKHLLGAHADEVVEIAANQAVHADIDTPAALSALRQRMAGANEPA
jgi:molybdenum cofactor cytidylyltransferase